MSVSTDEMKQAKKERKARKKRMKSLMSTIEKITNVVRDLEPDRIRAKTQGDGITQLRRKFNQHVDRNTLAFLTDEGRLVNTHYVRGTDEHALPDAVFMLTTLDGKPLIGTRFNFEDKDGDSGTEQSPLTITAEAFNGIALEIVLADLEDDGFRNLGDA